MEIIYSIGIKHIKLNYLFPPIVTSSIFQNLISQTHGSNGFPNVKQHHFPSKSMEWWENHLAYPYGPSKDAMSYPTSSFLPWKSLITCLILLIMELKGSDFLMAFL